MFKQICVVGAEAFEEECRAKIFELSAEPVEWIEKREVPSGQTFAGVDSLLVALRVDLGTDILSQFPQLRYVGIYGTNLVPVDLATCQRRDISVRNIHDYCDEDTAQWCMLQMHMTARGYGALPWRDMPEALFGQTLAVLGLGPFAFHVAQLGRAYGMSVRYCARSAKPHAEALGMRFGTLEEVLAEAQFISVHTPASSQLITRELTQRLPAGAVIVNTCVGQPIEPNGLRIWLDERDGRLILDSLGGVYYPELHQHPRVHVTPELAHMTARSELRRRELLISNMTTYLGMHASSK